MPTPDHEISGRVPLHGGQPPDGFRPVARPPILAERPEIADRGLASFFPSPPVEPEGSTPGKEPASRVVTAPGTPVGPAPERGRGVQAPEMPAPDRVNDVPQGEGSPAKERGARPGSTPTVQLVSDPGGERIDIRFLPPDASDEAQVHQVAAGPSGQGRPDDARCEAESAASGQERQRNPRTTGAERGGARSQEEVRAEGGGSISRSQARRLTLDDLADADVQAAIFRKGDAEEEQAKAHGTVSEKPGSDHEAKGQGGEQASEERSDSAQEREVATGAPKEVPKEQIAAGQREQSRPDAPQSPKGQKERRLALGDLGDREVLEKLFGDEFTITTSEETSTAAGARDRSSRSTARSEETRHFRHHTAERGPELSSTMNGLLRATDARRGREVVIDPSYEALPTRDKLLYCASAEFKAQQPWVRRALAARAIGEALRADPLSPEMEDIKIQVVIPEEYHADDIVEADVHVVYPDNEGKDRMVSLFDTILYEHAGITHRDITEYPARRFETLREKAARKRAIVATLSELVSRDRIEDKERVLSGQPKRSRSRTEQQTGRSYPEMLKYIALASYIADSLALEEYDAASGNPRLLEPLFVPGLYSESSQDFTLDMWMAGAVLQIEGIVEEHIPEQLMDIPGALPVRVKWGQLLRDAERYMPYEDTSGSGRETPKKRPLNQQYYQAAAYLVEVLGRQDIWERVRDDRELPVVSKSIELRRVHGVKTESVIPDDELEEFNNLSTVEQLNIAWDEAVGTSSGDIIRRRKGDQKVALAIRHALELPAEAREYYIYSIAPMNDRNEFDVYDLDRPEYTVAVVFEDENRARKVLRARRSMLERPVGYGTANKYPIDMLVEEGVDEFIPESTADIYNRTTSEIRFIIDREIYYIKQWKKLLKGGPRMSARQRTHMDMLSNELDRLSSLKAKRMINVLDAAEELGFGELIEIENVTQGGHPLVKFRYADLVQTNILAWLQAGEGREEIGRDFIPPEKPEDITFPLELLIRMSQTEKGVIAKVGGNEAAAELLERIALDKMRKGEHS